MNAEELIFLVSVTVVMPVLALWIVLNYQKARMKYRQSQPDKSLTTTELNDLIEDSVAAATAPLVERIEALENQMDEQISAPSRSSAMKGALDDEPDGSTSERPSKTLGRTRA